MATVMTAGSSRTIEPAARLSGSLVLPGDKSISHRALILGLLARGTTRISAASDGADVRSTAGVIEALGAAVHRSANQDLGVDYVVESPGAGSLRAPARSLDCGNSGTTMRLMAGVLAGEPLQAVLDGDRSLRSRPMARIVEPLRQMGADVGGSAGATAPLTVSGRRPLAPIDWTTTVPSAQVKSAILLAGLAAHGVTTVRESVATRDHTERMLEARGVTVTTEAGSSGAAVVRVEGGRPVQARDERVPGDVSAAAFWLVAAAIHPSANLDLRDVNMNPSRTRILEILGRMGAAITSGRYAAARAEMSEPTAELKSMSADLVATEVSARETAEAIDEVPILCLAATQARGRTVIRGAGELRHKESDRIAATIDGLASLGARISVAGDDIEIDGPTALRGAVVESRGDHRIAMTLAIAALVATGATTILDADCVGISYPSFFADLERIRS